MPTVTVIRWTPVAARADVTCRRPRRRRSSDTPSSPTRPSDPLFGLWKVSSVELCSLMTSSAASSVPANDTTTPWSRNAGDAAAVTAPRRFDGPS